jgi:FkbM family methyltransferase
MIVALFFIYNYSGNIGYYSLVSASMGDFKIDSFEPNLKNALRFCESLVMNSWKNEQEQESADQGALFDPVVPLGRPSVNIWPAGVSDTTGTLRFFESYGNPGAGRFTSNFGNNRTDYMELPVTTLDVFAEERGWFESRPRIAIMKVDVERHEANVLVGAEKLLKAGIVQNIFTETSLEDPERRHIEAAALELLVKAGYKLRGQGGWSGPGKDNPWPNDEHLVEHIFDYLERENVEYLNLWWSL